MNAPVLRYHFATRALVLAIAGVDRWVKLLVQARLPQGVVIAVIPGLFNLTHLENPGAAFGLFADLPPGVRLPLLIGVSVAALGFLLYLYCQAGWQAPLPRLGLAFIGGGALGNLYERVFVGVVVDYLNVFVGRYHWPAFNVADTAITLGAGLLVLSTLRAPRKHREVPTDPPTLGRLTMRSALAERTREALAAVTNLLTETRRSNCRPAAHRPCTRPRLVGGAETAARIPRETDVSPSPRRIRTAA
jgi:signal peptidase II